MKLGDLLRVFVVIVRCFIHSEGSMILLLQSADTAYSAELLRSLYKLRCSVTKTFVYICVSSCPNHKGVISYKHFILGPQSSILWQSY